MKKTALFSAIGMLAAWGTHAAAEEVGRVISSTPVVQHVAVPRQVCTSQPVAVQQPNSGAGAVMGGIAGGAMGNAIGQGSGRAVATVLGVIGGAVLGNRIEGSGTQVQNMQQCSTQTSYESRTVAYNVVYEYAGKQFNVQMPNDPGSTIRLQLTPVGGDSTASGMGAPASATSAQPVIVAPPVDPQTLASGQVQAGSGQPVGRVIAVAPAPVAYTGYPVYYPTYYGAPYSPYYYPPIGLSLNFGFSSGGHHHGHHHWR